MSYKKPAVRKNILGFPKVWAIMWPWVFSFCMKNTDAHQLALSSAAQMSQFGSGLLMRRHGDRTQGDVNIGAEALQLHQQGIISDLELRKIQSLGSISDVKLRNSFPKDAPVSESKHVLLQSLQGRDQDQDSIQDQHQDRDSASRAERQYCYWEHTPDAEMFLEASQEHHKKVLMSSRFKNRNEGNSESNAITTKGKKASFAVVETGVWKSMYEKNQALWTRVNFKDTCALRSSVPLTMLYVLQRYPTLTTNYDNDSVGPDLTIHVLGATYAFEGRSDWRLFRRLVQHALPKVKRVHILMDFGGPSHAHMGPDDAQALGQGFDGMPEVAFNRSDVCFSDPKVGIYVHCMFGYWQYDQDVLQLGVVTPDLRTSGPHHPPDMAIMLNSGLGQVQRRSWDPVISYLLTCNITTIISTPTAGGFQGVAGGVYNPPSYNEIEPVRCASVMNAYGANIVQTVVSPFPVVNDRAKANSVLAVYKGYKDGAEPCKPKSLPSEEMDWLENRAGDPDISADISILNDSGQFDPDFATVMRKPVCAEYDEAVAENVLALLQMTELVGSPKAQALVKHLSEKGEDGRPRRIEVWDWPWLFPLTRMRVRS